MKRIIANLTIVSCLTVSLFCVSFVNIKMGVSLSFWTGLEWLILSIILITIFDHFFFEGNIFEDVKSESDKLETKYEEALKEIELLKKRIKELEK